MFVRGVIGADGAAGGCGGTDSVLQDRWGGRKRLEEVQHGAGIVQLHRPKTKWLPFARSVSQKLRAESCF